MMWVCFSHYRFSKYGRRSLHHQSLQQKEMSCSYPNMPLGTPGASAETKQTSDLRLRKCGWCPCDHPALICQYSSRWGRGRLLLRTGVQGCWTDTSTVLNWTSPTIVLVWVNSFWRKGSCRWLQMPLANFYRSSQASNHYSSNYSYEKGPAKSAMDWQCKELAFVLCNINRNQ